MTMRCDYTSMPATDKVGEARGRADLSAGPRGRAGVPPGGPAPARRLPGQRGGVRGDRRPGAGPGTLLRQRAIHPYRRLVLHQPRWAGRLLRGALDTD
jgi:hypothetical protein